jgi:hypothetical protein
VALAADARVRKQLMYSGTLQLGCDNADLYVDRETETIPLRKYGQT